jgi:hypothetical protein
MAVPSVIFNQVTAIKGDSELLVKRLQVLQANAAIDYPDGTADVPQNLQAKIPQAIADAQGIVATMQALWDDYIVPNS